MFATVWDSCHTFDPGETWQKGRAVVTRLLCWHDVLQSYDLMFRYVEA
jgi:hypothetical protein